MEAWLSLIALSLLNGQQEDFFGEDQYSLASPERAPCSVSYTGRIAANSHSASFVGLQGE